MAKINITLDLDWFGEDGSLDEAIKKGITESVVKKISEDTLEDISEKVDTVISTEISKRLNTYMDEIFSKPRTVTDKWGEIIKENVTIKSQLSEALEHFIDQKVDDKGNPDSYSYSKKTRVEYMAEKFYKDYCSSTIERIAKETADTIKKLAEQQMSARMGKKMADLLGLSEELGLK